MRVILVSCGKMKESMAVAAKDLYLSPSFRNRRKIAESQSDRWFILSGSHGLVEPEAILEPYEKDLNDAGEVERREWSDRVVDQIVATLGPDLRSSTIEVLAGSAYCAYGLRQGLEHVGASVQWPVEGMRQGEQGAYYSRRAAETDTGHIEKRPLSVSPTYRRLYDYLLEQTEDSIALSFKELEAILARRLPPSARKHQAWWSGSVPSSSWRAAGWGLEKVDRTKEVATFFRGERIVITDPPPPQWDPSEAAVSDDEVVREAVLKLTDEAEAESAATFPSRGQLVDLPGMYSWWADSEARQLISTALKSEMPPLIYAGQAGAGKKNPTLESRILKMHLWNRIEFSTFRFTLAALIAGQVGLEIAGPKLLAAESEEELTEWMKKHLSIAVFALSDRDTIRSVEGKVLHLLDPPLNIMGMPVTPIRLRLRQLRAEIARGQIPSPYQDSRPIEE